MPVIQWKTRTELLLGTVTLDVDVVGTESLPIITPYEVDIRSQDSLIASDTWDIKGNPASDGDTPGIDIGDLVGFSSSGNGWHYISHDIKIDDLSGSAANTVQADLYTPWGLTSPMGRHIIREGDGSGDWWVVYCDDGDVKLENSADGNTWTTTPENVYTSSDTQTQGAVECAMVFASDVGTSGTLFIVYHLWNNDKIYAISYDINGDSFSSPTEITGIESSNKWNLVIDRDCTGWLWVGYCTFREDLTKPTCVYYVMRSTNPNDETAWGADVAVDDSGQGGATDYGLGQMRLHCRGIIDSTEKTTDGDMESADPTANWNTGGSNTKAAEAVIVHGGLKSLKITYVDDTELCTAAGDMTLSASTYYYAEGWVYIDSGNSSLTNVSIGITGFSDAVYVNQEMDDTAVTDTWTKISVTFLTGTDTSGKITFTGNAGTNGDIAYFDDVSCFSGSDEVLMVHGYRPANNNYSIYSVRNDGTGDLAGDWGSRVDTGIDGDWSEFDLPTLVSEWRDWLLFPQHGTARPDGANVYCVTIWGTTRYVSKYTWSSDSWAAGSTRVGTNTADWCCLSYGTSGTDLRVFYKQSNTIYYEDYDYNTDTWAGSETQLEAENPYCLTCTDGFSTIGDNQCLWINYDAATDIP